ncbi:unnamed protein product [Symbiodinium natans]|uniref:Fungal lipase-type domain-containing protein n=1 Tax=Symbiodinium natans TaxID=878477 RepID=A0A812UX63_9DINO|nr:unnamed protein product [Symbiodinium natans]
MFVCDVNGKAVAVPCNAEKILVVDPSKGEASAIDIPTGIDARRDSKFCCACFVNGKAVAVPFNAEKILVVDPAAGQASTIDLPKILDTQTSAKFCSVCKVNGKATAVPQDSTRILVVDPSTGEASAIDLPAGIDSRKVSKFGSVCNVNGKAVAVPQEAEKILLVDVAGSGERTRSLDLTLHNTEVPWKAEFAEMVAAVLSYWIYTDDPKPPHLQHAAMTVHRVTQPGEFGSAVKIATVTAELPSEKVLYVVFKGTSYILDFLNWNLELDHATTEDTDFFIHGGAAGTLRGAQFWKERDFLERLASAKAQGVQKIVFTGHSLGGMYAAALLYVAWKKITGGPSDGQQLLKSFDVRCVTFGSPMVFGGGSQGSKQAKSFQEFAQERAANYIHANDPCPRAWGALDLRQFVEAAARNVQNGLVDELGCIKGQVVSKVVEEAARQVLQRPDFNLLEDFGRKYQHFIPLKVLTGTKQFVNWKEFQLTPDCLKDHSVQSYVNRLFDAFDDCRPDCHVHSQLP